MQGPYQPPPVPDVRLFQPPVPNNVAMAFGFIKMCNKVMGPTFNGHDVAGHVQVMERELHPTQEAAFRLACMAVGRYFSEEYGDGYETTWCETPELHHVPGAHEAGGPGERVVQDG